MNKARLFIKKIIKRFIPIPSYCKVCGKSVTDFHVPDDLWLSMTGNKWTIWCFECFTKKARKMGVCTIFDIFPHDDNEFIGEGESKIFDKLIKKFSDKTIYD